MSAATPPPKKDQLLRLLKHGSVFVHLDPRREGVVVPSWLANQPQLVLQLGLNFAIPIPDLEVDDDGVRCTLSFNRAPYHCDLPWSAVYALVAEDGQVTVWPTELPAELIPGHGAVRSNAPTSRSQRPKAPSKPRVSVEPAAEARETSPPPTSPSLPPTAPSLPPTAPSLPPPAPAPVAILGTPKDNRAARGNDSVTMLPPAAEEPEERKTSRRSLPPYLRVVK